MAEAGTIKPFGALMRPRALALACIAVLVACGWGYLALTLATIVVLTLRSHQVLAPQAEAVESGANALASSPRKAAV